MFSQNVYNLHSIGSVYLIAKAADIHFTKSLKLSVNTSEFSV